MENLYANLRFTSALMHFLKFSIYTFSIFQFLISNDKVKVMGWTCTQISPRSLIGVVTLLYVKVHCWG